MLTSRPQYAFIIESHKCLKLSGYLIFAEESTLYKDFNGDCCGIGVCLFVC